MVRTGLPDAFRRKVRNIAERNLVKCPDEFSGARIERADVAGRGAITLVGGRAENDQVLKDAAGSGGLDEGDGFGIAIKTLLQVDAPAFTERSDELARAGVDGAERMIAGEEQVTMSAVLGFPEEGETFHAADYGEAQRRAKLVGFRFLSWN